MNTIKYIYQHLLLKYFSVMISPVNFPVGSEQKFLLVPAAAPGGLGDEAMVSGAVEAINQIYPDPRIYILTSKQFEQEFNLQYDVTYLRLLSRYAHPREEVLKAGFFSDIFFLGADILDGAYDLSDAYKRVAMAKIYSESGGNVRIVGFSLSDSIRPEMIEIFNKAKLVTLMLRDPISFSRARKYVKNANSVLTADVAFLMPASMGIKNQSLLDFVDLSRREGRRVIGFNIHALLDRSLSESESQFFLSNLARLIENFDGCSFVFLPHDYRRGVDDRVQLANVFKLLSDNVKNRVFFDRTVYCARDLKAICQLLDGFFTGRMHLAIASLGVGVPVFGIAYQGKFEGTLSYFSVPNHHIMQPQDILNYNQLSHNFNDWLENLSALRINVVEGYSSVKEASVKNFKR